MPAAPSSLRLRHESLQFPSPPPLSSLDSGVLDPRLPFAIQEPVPPAPNTRPRISLQPPSQMSLFEKAKGAKEMLQQRCQKNRCFSATSVILYTDPPPPLSPVACPPLLPGPRCGTNIQLTPFSHQKPTPWLRVWGDVRVPGTQQPSWTSLGKPEFRLSA